MKFSQISYELLPAIFLLICTSYLLGHVLLFSFKIVLKSNASYNVFVKTIFGLLLIITTQAIITTHGVTIQWGLIIIGIIWCLDYKKNNQIPIYSLNELKIKKNELISVCLLLTVAFIVYVIQGSLFYNPPFNNVPHGDYSFYSTIIEGYKYYGIETKNTVINTIKDNYSPSMYHHTDLWVSFIFFKYFTTSSIEAITMGSYTILCSILIIGLIGFSKNFTKKKSIIFISVFFIYYSGVPFIKIIPQIDTFIYGIGYNPKNISIAILAIGSTLMSINKNKQFYYPLLALPIINIITLPAVFGALIIMVLSCFIYFRKSWIYSIAKKIIINLILICVFIFTFYYLTSVTFVATPKEFSVFEIIQGIKTEPIKPILIIFGTIICCIILYIIPFSITIYLIKLNGWKKINIGVSENLFFTLLIGICGLITWSLLNILKDSAQIFYLPFLTFLNLFFLVLFLKVDLQKTNNWLVNNLVQLAIILTLIINYINIKAYNPFLNFYSIDDKSISYLKKIKTILDSEKKPVKIAYQVNIKNFDKFWYAIPYHQADGYIKNLVSGTKQISINTMEVDLTKYSSQEKNTLEKEINSSSFKLYIDSLIKNNAFTNLKNAKLSFIKDKKFKYLICEKGAEKIDINEYFIINQIIEDPLSKELFYVINTK